MQATDQAMNSHVWTDLEAFGVFVKTMRRSRMTLVQCDGVYDLVHHGHIDSFWQARGLGDFLYVVLVGDGYVNKGPDRPRFVEKTRALWLASLRPVDAVIINQAAGPQNVLERIRPEVLVKGSEYQTNPLPGFLENKAFVESYGGSVVYVKELAHSSQILGGSRV